MHDVSLRFALTAPSPCSGDATAKKDLTQALANFREASAIMVIKGIRARPVNGEMRYQGKTD